MHREIFKNYLLLRLPEENAKNYAERKTAVTEMIADGQDENGLCGIDLAKSRLSSASSTMRANRRVARERDSI